MREPFAKPTPPALRPPTQAQIATVTDGLEYKWSHNALAIQDRLTQAVEYGDASAAQKWAIAGGISTEKVLLMKGRPTELVGHIHAHRHDLGDVMEKLSRALRPATISVAPVVHLDSFTPKSTIPDVELGNDLSSPRIASLSDPGTAQQTGPGTH